MAQIDQDSQFIENSRRDYYRNILLDTLRYSREREYVGWDYWDGLSSQVRHALPIETRWTNLAFQEIIKRAPINLRPFLLVEQRESPLGLSLFSMATLNAYELTGQRTFRDETRSLLERVVSHNQEAYNGFCLYHNHETQTLSRTNPIGIPGIVATSFGVKALLHGEAIDDSYPEVADTAPEYVESTLEPNQTEEGIKINYTPIEKDGVYTLNANALAARLYVDLYDYFGNDEYREIADGILSYVASRQEPIGGWKYADPPSASHLSMDNFHNGFIIESFLRYGEVIESESFSDVVDRGLSFYRTQLFEENGTPHWDEKNKYPLDIHNAAQGIIVFSQTGDHEFASNILDWALENLYAGGGQFYYQKRKYYTKRFTLMRWCQAWMAYALTVYLTEKNE